ncbi:hypothetical protein D3C76_1683240 [compost metagenome]
MLHDSSTNAWDSLKWFGRRAGKGYKLRITCISLYVPVFSYDSNMSTMDTFQQIRPIFSY